VLPVCKVWIAKNLFQSSTVSTNRTYAAYMPIDVKVHFALLRNFATMNDLHVQSSSA